MKVTINGREVEAREGENVLQLARRHDIEIPHFCYHQKLSVAGNCRLCLVKVNGLPKLMPACNVVAMPDMKVETEAEEVRKARRDVMQFILLNHPVDCGICDKAGECRLQDYQHEYGPAQSRSADPKIHRRKLVELSPRISLDNERCILCSRCVRFTREISKSNALGIVERGAHSFVERTGEGPFDDPYSDNVIGICPVGALLSRDFLYASRVWFLEPVRSVCNGCARGCSVQVWRRRKEREQHAPGMARAHGAYRVTALENPEINGPWICNKGFDLHKAMARPRALQPRAGGDAVAPEAALDAARALLARAQRPAVLVSAHASNEELDDFATSLGARPGLQVYVRQDCRPAPGEVVEDHLLIRADKNPNTHGARQRFGDRAFDAAAGHDLVLLWGETASTEDVPDGMRWIHLTSFESPASARAEVVIPVSTHFERAGHFTNFEGKPNAFEPVFDKPPGVLHAADVFRELAR